MANLRVPARPAPIKLGDWVREKKRMGPPLLVVDAMPRSAEITVGYRCRLLGEGKIVVREFTLPRADVYRINRFRRVM